MVRYLEVDSPVGPLLVLSRNDKLTRLEFTGQPHAHGIPESAQRGGPFLANVAEQLKQYFEALRRDFDVAISLDGTDFQKSVWKYLREIPWGETRSYGELADSLSNPAASRAVGAANGRNPISIIVPCHRVVGSDGAITGYAGGPDNKRWLLRHETSKLYI